jgi:hypothetical protein
MLGGTNMLVFSIKIWPPPSLLVSCMALNLGTRDDPEINPEIFGCSINFPVTGSVATREPLAMLATFRESAIVTVVADNVPEITTDPTSKVEALTLFTYSFFDAESPDPGSKRLDTLMCIYKYT